MMNIPTIIQGGMGVAISDWGLARSVAQAGELGVVSGTGLGFILIARLMDGDPDGHIRRALAAFPDPAIADAILDKYYIPGGKAPDAGYIRPPMWTMRPNKHLQQLTVVANFIEVWLAKEGHANPVGINLLEKVQMPNMASLYGAMLAGVDVVIMGAGIPLQIPGILDALTVHEDVSYRLDVLNAGKDDDIRLVFSPLGSFPGIDAIGELKRPAFLPIISSVVLAQALLKRATGSIEGFVIETPLAGGHNAPPRGAMQLDEAGQPIYGDKDAVDLEKIKKLGKPFWLAGSYGSPEALSAALEAGAQGVQVGTAFAYCEQSGMAAHLRAQIIEKVLAGEAEVFTSPLASPTGFPFKTVMLDGTLTEGDLYAERERVCDVGFLRQAYINDKDKIGFRCPAEPVAQYVKKGGKAQDTEGRTCLCNNLGAAAGFPNIRKNGYVEPALVTSGDDLVNIGQFIPPGQTSYSAADVVTHLRRGIPELA